MRKAILILTVFISLKTFSQVVGSQFMPDRSYSKSAIDIWYCMTCHIYSYPNYFIKGDTTISGKYYQKVFFSDKSLFDTICFNWTDLMHYNNGKVYLDTNLIYDFSLLVGDTFKLHVGYTSNHPAGIYSYTVAVSDSVYLGSKWRKRLTLNKASPVAGLVQLKWVDGIGDINHGFNCDYATAEFAYHYTFNCFGEKLIGIFGTNCGINQFCGTSSAPVSSIPCSSTYGIVYFSLNGGNKPYTYSVQPPASCGGSFTTAVNNINTSFSLTCGGSYTFSIWDSLNTYMGTVVKSLSFDSVINVNIAASKYSVCLGDSTTLSMNPMAPTYTINPINWSTGATSSSIVVTPTATTTYSLNGLYTTASTKTCTAEGSNTITVYPVPILNASTSNTLLCSGEIATLTATGADTYTWFPSLYALPTILVYPSTTTNYLVIGQNLYGCYSTATIIQVVDPCIGIKEYNLDKTSIYPNPASTCITINIVNKNNMEVEIINSLGQAVLKQIYLDKIDVSGLSNGMYTVKITQEYGKNYYSKFIKE